MRRILPILLTAACATTAPETAPAAAPARLEVRQRPPPPPFDGRVFASQQMTPAECEVAARNLKQRSPDEAWQALVGCVERARWPRGEFTHLDRLTAGAWDDDLQSRPDAPRLVARVIALRGGDVEGDLAQVQKRRLPVFTLAAAMRQPAVYKGRYVLMRGSLDDIKMDGSVTTAKVHETSLRATAHEQEVGKRYHSSSSSKWSNTVTMRDRQGVTTIGPGESQHSRESYATVRRYDNERAETGRVAMGRLPQADPFLEPGQDFVFLVRFDGLRGASLDDEKAAAVVTIMGYFKPNALMLE